MKKEGINTQILNRDRYSQNAALIYNIYISVPVQSDTLLHVTGTGDFYKIQQIVKTDRLLMSQIKESKNKNGKFMECL